jgi:hypothetical protein
MMTPVKPELFASGGLWLLAYRRGEKSRVVSRPVLQAICVVATTLSYPALLAVTVIRPDVRLTV